MKQLFTFANSFVVITVLCMMLGCAGTGKTSIDPQMQMAPSAEEQAVIQVAQDLFDAMRAGDGDKVRSLFIEGAELRSVGERNGEPSMNVTPMDRFAAAVAQPHDQMWDEQFWDTNVQINGRLASMWMSYAFYLGGKLSHCGVNTFMLFKDTAGWKVMSLADTRQREGCQIPESVKPVVN